MDSRFGLVWLDLWRECLIGLDDLAFIDVGFLRGLAVLEWGDDAGLV